MRRNHGMNPARYGAIPRITISPPATTSGASAVNFAAKASPATPAITYSVVRHCARVRACQCNKKT